MTDPGTPLYDVFLSYGEDEAQAAELLRNDLMRAGFTMCPDSQVSSTVIEQTRVVVALQSSPKPSDMVRAALAVAQLPVFDRPIITVYVKNNQIALRRQGNNAVYEEYNEGMARLIGIIWAALGDPRGRVEIDEPIEVGNSWIDWLNQQ